jgi:hypothetical protein
MLRIRHDKPLHEADTLLHLEALIAGSSSPDNVPLTPPPDPAMP